MLTYIPPAKLTQEHLHRLVQSQQAAPVFEQTSPTKMIEELWSGAALAFSYPPSGLLIVKKLTADNGTSRLSIVAFAGFSGIYKRLHLAADLRRLAADWRCDTIETTCYDPRLARAICKIGGRIESFTVTLSVERSSDGR